MLVLRTRRSFSSLASRDKTAISQHLSAVNSSDCAVGFGLRQDVAPPGQMAQKRPVRRTKQEYSHTAKWLRF
jgi:hypothetical protein